MSSSIEEADGSSSVHVAVPSSLSRQNSFHHPSSSDTAAATRDDPGEDECESGSDSDEDVDGWHEHPHHRRGRHSRRDSEGRGLLAGSGSHAAPSDAPTSATSHPHHHQRHQRQDFTTLLLVFTCCNLLTYFDRGSIGVCLDSIMRPEVYGLSSFQGGVLAGAYMFGYITASPLFALAVRSYDPFRLVSFGLVVWSLAALGCASSIGFVSLLLARAISGVGEAAFLCIAPPFIDKCAPPEKKSRWMAIFYCAIPIGYALGFVVSGHWLNINVLPLYYHWRVIFAVECVFMFPFIWWLLRTPTPPHNFRDPPPPPSRDAHQRQQQEIHEQIHGDPEHEHNSQQSNSGPWTPEEQAAFEAREDARRAAAGVTKFDEYLASVSEVLSNKVYMLIISGYCAQTFVLGSVAFFGVRYLMENFNFSVGEAGSYFGAITVVVGVVGSFAGGWMCDVFRKGKNKAHATATTMKLAFMLMSIAFPLCLLAFAKNDPVYFFVFFIMSEFLLFATASPINSVVIWAVPFRLAPLACSLSIIFIHVLGDAISPAIIGAVLDATKNWRLTMTVNTCWLCWSVLFWGLAWRAASKRAMEIDQLIEQHLEREHQQQNEAERQHLASGGGVGMIEGNMEPGFSDAIAAAMSSPSVSASASVSAIPAPASPSSASPSPGAEVPASVTSSSSSGLDGEKSKGD